jgi:hypothetical protein
MMISVGLWIVPTIATVLAFWTAWIKRNTGYPATIYNVVRYATAVLVSVVSWLVWALIT